MKKEYFALITIVFALLAIGYAFFTNTIDPCKLFSNIAIIAIAIPVIGGGHY